MTCWRKERVGSTKGNGGSGEGIEGGRKGGREEGRKERRKGRRNAGKEGGWKEWGKEEREGGREGGSWLVSLHPFSTLDVFRAWPLLPFHVSLSDYQISQ